MKRILIIEVNWLGDVLFTTPAIRAIREGNPGAFIACMVVPRCIEMLEGNPNINELIIYDENGKHRGIFSKLLFISKLKKRNFDTAVSFHRSMSRMLIAYLAGIRRRIGYYTRKRSWLLTDIVHMPIHQPHRVEYFLNIIKAFGFTPKDKDYEFHIPRDSFIKADKILKEAGIGPEEVFFVINPGGNWLPKRWPKENFIHLCKALEAQYRKKRIVITGSEKDIPLADDIIRETGSAVISVCGKTDLKGLGAIMKRASLVIANDSGPMHIAVSQKTPTIALFGPTSPKITGPYGESRYIVLHKWFDCQTPCYKACNNYRCMESVKVEDVLEAVKRLMS